MPASRGWPSGAISRRARCPVVSSFRIMRKINEEDGVSMLLVEQNANLALDLAHHAYLLETGTVALSGPSEQIKNDESVRRAYLGY